MINKYASCCTGLSEHKIADITCIDDKVRHGVCLSCNMRFIGPLNLDVWRPTRYSLWAKEASE